ncbi:CaiB/BaiF CoA transferase family protein [Phreatobacter stygius]|uniref:CoA transferase n=1 Tax=Phreatobacter stygius TaxID=1940610 RepID=A0A4D7AW64_9HYPH|nr:CaiB/BaiF CoA-transferase family protein [Phreatobacter stygius]QCI65299.1 CoA transferase [Phreatobacter stygius]
MPEPIQTTAAASRRHGPLSGVRVVELAGIGPTPMCAMLLADLGADIVRIDRLAPSGNGIERPARFDLTNRGRPSVAVDLKRPEGIACVLDLVAGADALIEGFRPGTMERLGLGPEICLARNPRLVFGRLTGWGQTGPLAQAAGHDLNYIALAGALGAIGRRDAPPTPPLNLIGDFGGGAMLMAFGLLAAVLEARTSGLGQVVDAAMVDGTATLLTSLCGLQAAGLHNGPRGTNLLDSGAPHYDVYRCADGEWISIAPIEAKFRSQLITLLGLDADAFPDVAEPANWPAARDILAAHFRRRTRAEWQALLEGTDACFAPVLSLPEAAAHPHMRERGTFVAIDGITQPAPAPRFSRTPPDLPAPPEALGASSRAALAHWGIPPERIAALEAAGTIRDTGPKPGQPHP